MLNQKLQLKLSQKLSPQQIQLMKLIQLTTAELEQKIKNEIEENPALEMGKEKTEVENDDFGQYGTGISALGSGTLNNQVEIIQFGILTMF